MWVLKIWSGKSERQGGKESNGEGAVRPRGNRTAHVDYSVCGCDTV